MVRVLVEAPPIPKLTLAERFLLGFGSPRVVNRLCTIAAVLCGVLPLVYLALWFFWFRGVVRNTFHPTIAQDFLMGLAWAPVMGLQVLIMALRYASLTLTIKGAEQLAAANHAQFFHTLREQVAEAVQRHTATHPPEAPTLQ